MNIILLGLPGAGKGTHAKKINKKYENIYHLSSGELVRKAATQNTSTGAEIKRYMNQGKLVPDKIVIQLIKDKIIKFKGNNFVFDGFPRNMEQVHILEKILQLIKEKVHLCLYLKVAEKSLIKRLSGRRVCSNCGAIYNLNFDPPQKEDICDKCGGKLYQREDDEKEVVKKRIEENREKTNKIKNYYQNEGILETVIGTDKTPEEVQREVEKTINNYKSKADFK